MANYYVATRPINAGETLGPTDFAAREGDLTTLPRSVITNPANLTAWLPSTTLLRGRHCGWSCCAAQSWYSRDKT